jgi:hypothetical protein
MCSAEIIHDARLDEARFFYGRLFNIDASIELVERYEKACAGIVPSWNSLLVREKIAKIIKHQLDLEAIEFFLRLQKGDNPITHRVNVLCYIIETTPQYYVRFHNEVNCSIKVFIAMVGYVFRSLVKLIKGAYLVWRYELI